MATNVGDDEASSEHRACRSSRTVAPIALTDAVGDQNPTTIPSSSALWLKTTQTPPTEKCTGLKSFCP